MCMNNRLWQRQRDGCESESPSLLCTLVPQRPQPLSLRRIYRCPAAERTCGPREQRPLWQLCPISPKSRHHRGNAPWDCRPPHNHQPRKHHHHTSPACCPRCPQTATPLPYSAGAIRLQGPQKATLLLCSAILYQNLLPPPHQPPPPGLLPEPHHLHEQ